MACEPDSWDTWRARFIDTLYRDEEGRELLDDSGWVVTERLYARCMKPLFETRKDVLLGCPKLAQSILMHLLVNREAESIEWLLNDVGIVPSVEVLERCAYILSLERGTSDYKDTIKIAVLMLEHATCDFNVKCEDGESLHAKFLKHCICVRKTTHPSQARTWFMLKKSTIKQLIQKGDCHTQTALYVNEQLQLRFPENETGHAKRLIWLLKRLLAHDSTNINAFNDKKITMLALNLRTVADKRSSPRQRLTACWVANYLLDCGAEIDVEGVKPASRQSSEIFQRIPTTANKEIHTLKMRLFGITIPALG